MPDLPVLEGPLPEGLTTVKQWAPKQNRSPAYVNKFWRKAGDWPAAVGQLPGRAAGGGGRRKQVYEEHELDAFRARHPEYRREARMAVRIEPELPDDTLVTLRQVASMIVSDGTPEAKPGVAPRNVSQYHKGLHADPGFPAPVEEDVWRLRDLAGYWPYPVDTLLDGATLVTAAVFAQISGVSAETVAQY